MPMKEALDAFYFHNKQHSPQTQVWYTVRLNHFAEWCEAQKLELEQITARHIRHYIDELIVRGNIANGKSGPLSTYTVHGHARIIRTFFNWLAMQEEFENTIDPRIGTRIPMPKIQVKVVETFSNDEIARLFAACNDDFTWPMIVNRNKAILSVLLDTGIRAGELCGLTLDHCYLDRPDPYIRVMGKGSKEREVGLGHKSLAALREYIQHYRKAPADDKHVFIGIRYKPLLPNGLDQLMKRLGRRAKIKDAHPHKFRHTWAVNFLLLGGDVYALSCLLGHASLDITQVYVRTVKSMQARKLSKSVLDLL